MEPVRVALLGCGVVGTEVARNLTTHGAELVEAAAKAGVDLLYEAAVAGAVPLIRPLRESLAGDRLLRVLGIVNGTTNYVLDKMHTMGMGFAEALEQGWHT